MNNYLKKLKKLYFFTLILITLVALGFLIYPILSNYINNKFAVSTISEYNKKINSISNDEIDDLTQKLNKYNNDLFNGTAPNKLPSSLNIKNGSLLGYIEIPSININLPVYFGTSSDDLKKGVGMLEGTSFPIGGENTHSVLAAHTGLTTQKLFTDIDKLKKGDVFTLHIFKNNLEYKVNQIKIVSPDQINDLKIVDGKDYVTLLTCYPYGVNTERLLVRGERTTLNSNDKNLDDKNLNDKNQIENNIKKTTETFNHININLIITLIILFIILLFLIILFLIMKFKSRSKS